MSSPIAKINAHIAAAKQGKAMHSPTKSCRSWLDNDLHVGGSLPGILHPTAAKSSSAKSNRSSLKELIRAPLQNTVDTPGLSGRSQDKFWETSAVNSWRTIFKSAVLNEGPFDNEAAIKNTSKISRSRGVPRNPVNAAVANGCESCPGTPCERHAAR
jgi:hypothetical protein